MFRELDFLTLGRRMSPQMSLELIGKIRIHASFTKWGDPDTDPKIMQPLLWGSPKER